MCETCLSSPCLDGCPNAKPPKRITTCVLCDDDIVDGEECAELPDGFAHIECIDGVCTSDLLIERYGLIVTTARREWLEWE